MMPRETPVGSFWVAQTEQPTTPLQALMEAAPGEDPAQSSMEDQDHELGDTIRQLLNDFSEDDRDILVMHTNGLSVRDIASNLGWDKMKVHRRLPGLMQKLAEKFRTNPEIMEHIYGSNDDDGEAE